jgi:hypothetical protein
MSHPYTVYENKNPEITFYGEYDFTMPNIQEVFEFYDIWEGLTHFRDKSGLLFPKRLIEKKNQIFTNCVKFKLRFKPNEKLTKKEMDDLKKETDDLINNTIKYPNFYGNGEILIETNKLLDQTTEKLPEDLKVRKHHLYMVNCEQYYGMVIVKDFIKCPYYIYQQNNGNHVIMSEDHIGQLNDKEKTVLGL